jgi:hypothetical protein
LELKTARDMGQYLWILTTETALFMRIITEAILEAVNDLNSIFLPTMDIFEASKGDVGMAMVPWVKPRW